MSYADGIGSLPQVSGATTPAAAKSAQQVPASTNHEAQQAAAPAMVQTDQAVLSTAAGLLATSLAGSDVRTSKVEALQRAIASGNYNVSSSDVADKMIQSLLEK
jgi:negative regulator of flagellin synthesis FlgM